MTVVVAPRASASTLVLALLAAITLSSASALLVVPSSPINAQGRLGALKSARPSLLQLSTTPAFATQHNCRSQNARDVALFAKASDDGHRLSSDKSRTQQRNLLTLLLKVSPQISKCRRYSPIAFLSLLLVGILKRTTPPAYAAAAAVAASKAASIGSSRSKFHNLRTLLPSSRAYAAVSTYGSAVAVMGIAIWAILIRPRNANSDDKEVENGSTESSMMKSSAGVGIPGGFPQGGINEPLPFSTEWIEEQLKLADEMKKKKPQIRKKLLGDGPETRKMNYGSPSSEWIEQEMNNVDKKRIQMQVSKKKPAVNEHPLGLSPPPL